MPLSAWITSIVVAIILYGGFALCVRQAVIKGREDKEKALHKEDFSQRFLRKHYQRPIKRGLGVQLKVHYLIRLILMNWEACCRGR